MSEIQSWQDILKDVILDPKERQRIAEELNVNPITLTRWASGKSIPKREYILLLVRVIPPEFRSSFAMSLIENQMFSLIDFESFEYAIEMATKVIDTLRPGIDPDTRAMAVQAVLPNWIQLQNSKGLELVLPAVPPATKSEEDKS